MISLSNTTEILELDTRIACRLDVVISYADHTATTFSPNGSQTQISTAANTTILTAPAAATQRIVQHLSITNIDFVTAQFFLLKDVSATDYRLTHLVTLKAGESIHYNSESGWINYDWNGRKRRPTTQSFSHEGIYRHPLGSQMVATSGTRLIHQGGTTVASYMGRAPRTSTKVLVKFRVTTASATITWGEIAIARGIPSLGNNATLTVLGVNAANNPITLASLGGTTANGNFTTVIDTQPMYQINEGDDIWILFGNLATTGVTLRCHTIADDLISGTTVTAETRPSLNIGNPIVYTVDSVANNPLYLAMSYY